MCAFVCLSVFLRLSELDFFLFSGHVGALRQSQARSTKSKLLWKFSFSSLPFLKPSACVWREQASV